MTIPVWYDQLFEEYRLLLQSKERLYIALSAGVDSNMLLHWLNHYQDQLPPITSLHVNHNWHGEYSHIWANFAKEISHHYGIEHQSYDLYFNENDPRGLEAAGREERYKIMSQAMVENSLLLVAHHRSDQAETLFHRLLRSSGVRGLGAMQAHTSLNFSGFSLEILRPLLSISKTELYRVAKKNGIKWMEDYTNHEVDGMVRNIIRNDIFPRIESHFPHYEAAFYQSSQFLQESFSLLEEVATEDLNRLSATPNQLSRTKFLKLSLPRQKNLLQYWLGQYNLTLSQEQMQEFYRSFIESDPTHQSQFVLGDYQIHFFQGYFYLINHQRYQSPPILDWETSINAPSKVFWEEKESQLSLVPRENGIRFHPLNRDRSQTLKKLLQEAKLPVWQRQNIWMLKDQQRDEIYWISHIGLSKSLEDEIQKSGWMPTLHFLSSESS